MKRSFGFTLAEVLITLGVIGIVAAMTLPSVMAKQRSKALEAKFHKRISEISQAILMLKKDDVYLFGTYTGPQMQSLLAAQFQGAKTSERAIYLQAKQTQKRLLGYELPTYKTFDKSGDFDKYVLDDGGIFVNKEFFIFINNDMHTLNSYQIIVDINGLQNPNIFGYDVFAFRLDKTDSIAPVSQAQSLCSKIYTNNRNGWSCSYFAMTDKNYFKNLSW